MDPASLFDVEPFRAEPGRVAVIRTVERPTLVLGSTQPDQVVNRALLAEQGVELRRRRGGGGAVFLPATGYLWVDAWVPRNDPLWDPDVSAAAAWAGWWWVSALRGSGGGDGVASFEVHGGRAEPGEFGDLVCFAGRGPGEVFSHGRKVMGLSQWRSREGALFSMCAYDHWDPAPLAGLLWASDADADSPQRDWDALAEVAIGVADLVGSTADLGVLGGELVASLPGWGREGDIRG